MIREYFESLESGLQAKLTAQPESPNPRKKYALELARLGRRLYSGSDRVAWCGVAAPFDLLNAMGVTSCFVEFIGAMLSSMGASGPFLEEAEHAGFGADACAYHRSVTGAAMKGMMPVPGFLIATTCPCTGGLGVLENLSRMFRRDLFVLQVPQEETRESVRYLADRIREMTRFVSDHTGEPIDEDRVRESMERTNRAAEAMEDVYRLARRVPSPVRGRDLANFGIVMALFLGTEAAVEISRAYCDEFSARIEKGESGVPDERFRLLWIQNRIQFRNPLIDLLEDEYQAAVVSDELNHVTWNPIDPDDPYTGMARRVISFPLNGPIERRVEHLRHLAEVYEIDGAINPCHWGCRQGTGARGLVTEGLKEIGVPVLNLEVDCVDVRNFSEGQLRTRIEAFMELLEGRGSVKH
jgi:benzoyl-CoA reductase/2-hydroxyglutaryl-CoA dehydratase subunit BcrC/BadD/HgdB